MEWYIYLRKNAQPVVIDRTPFILGRASSCDLSIPDPSVSREHLQIQTKGLDLVVKDLTAANTFSYTGELFDEITLSGRKREGAVLKLGSAFVAILPSTGNPASILQMLPEIEERYCFQTDGHGYGPVLSAELQSYIDGGILRGDSMFWVYGTKERVSAADVGGLGLGVQNYADNVSAGTGRKAPLDESAPVTLGETFLCPYCRAVSSVDDVLSISVHPDFLGDPVLGESEQQRFLPTRFTADGQAVDAGGIRCPDMACPRCHMMLPAFVLEKPLRIASIVGAPGAGKSYFLASSIWTARHTLTSRFGIGFYDLDPTINRWLNDYEERLFFQDDTESLQNIAKTQLQAVTVYRQALVDGNPLFLPLPSLFRLAPSKGETQVLAMYDNAGEHFQAGADSHQMPGTLHMINAEAILFLFDPSGDPRFRSFLNKGEGTASNKAQRQDILLVEMATRIKRHLGSKVDGQVNKPIIFGVSKADLIINHLPVGLSPYVEKVDGTWALDLSALGEMSSALRALLVKVVPEMVDTVESISDDVIYIPVSALGHNPMREGVRPADIKPFWVEVPLVYMLSRLGIVPTVSSLDHKAIRWG